MNDQSMNYPRWQTLMESLSFGENHDCFQVLHQAYCEPHRRYHTDAHIKATLCHFDMIASNLERPQLVELALWFHDAIYAPFSSKNERDSADWAASFMQQNAANEKEIALVYELVMATVHGKQRLTGDVAWLVGIDLSILGTQPDVYQRFEKDVRFEYKRVPYFLYKKKRKDVLRGFLQRSTIYQTTYFIDRYEETARDNIELALQQL